MNRTEAAAAFRSLPEAPTAKHLHQTLKIIKEIQDALSKTRNDWLLWELFNELMYLCSSVIKNK